MIQLAAAHAVRRTGGPSIPIRVGRADATGPDPEGRLPAEDADAKTQAAVFGRMGFSFRELIVLSGSHTLGSKGYGLPYEFDNSYFTGLEKRVWLDNSDPMNVHVGIESDHTLAEDPEAKPIIQEYARDNELFKADFAVAFAKLSEIGAQWT
jgi:L-ascorbate peroxidase